MIPNGQTLDRRSDTSARRRESDRGNAVDGDDVAPGESLYRRAHFRLPYPEVARPAFRVPGAVYAVTELSEVSARIVAPRGELPATGDMLDGVITLPGGRECPVEGVAVRGADNEALVWFSTGVSFKTMVEEQRRLLASHPEFLRGAIRGR
jgi:hypothetical protein